MDLRQARMGIVALVAGGALGGALLFGGALVSAQTPDNTPATDGTATPADPETPSVTPDSREMPSDGSGTERHQRDGECDKDGDGLPDGGAHFHGGGQPDSGAHFHSGGRPGSRAHFYGGGHPGSRA